jgi:hypothetical protein
MTVKIIEFPIVTAEITYRDASKDRKWCIKGLDESERMVNELITDLESAVLPSEQDEIQEMITVLVSHMTFCLETLDRVNGVLKQVAVAYN